MQPLSIRRLELEGLWLELNDAERAHWTARPFQQRIGHLCHRLVALFNAKLQAKEVVAAEGDEASSELYEKSCEKADFGEGFYLVFYTRQVASLSRLAQSLLKINPEAKSKVTATRVEHVGFLFREKAYTKPGQRAELKSDVYALTTSDAWRVVSKYTNLSFPHKIAQRLLENKVHNVVYQDLVGNALRTDKDFKEDEALPATRYLDRFIIEFTAPVRKCSSLFRLTSFANKGNKLPKSVPQAKIERGAVRFQTQLTLDEYPALLDHLSKVFHEESTYFVKVGQKQKMVDELGEVEPDAKIGNAANFLEVNAAESQALDKLMDEALWKAYQTGESINLFVSCRLLRDFAQSTSFRLVSRLIPRDELEHCQWNTPKNAEEIMQVLRDHIPAFKECKTADAFIRLFKQVKMEFNIRGSYEKCSLRKLFGGEVRISETQKTYFLVSGTWYAISSDFVRELQSEFQKLLKDCLLAEDDPLSLKRAWPTQAEIDTAKQAGTGLYAEDVYNRTYLPDPNFLVGDRVCVEDVELFDLLKIFPQKLQPEIACYFVKKDLGNTTRDVASQLRVSASLIHECLSTATPLNPSRIDQLCKALETRYPNCLNKVGGKDALVKALTQAPLTYVYALYDPRQKGTLFDDIKKKDHLQVQDLVKIEGHNAAIDPLRIFQGLQALQLITQEGFLTAKFRAIDKKTFTDEVGEALNCPKVRASELHDLICNTVRLSSNSIIALLELLKVRKQLEKKKIAFKICVIPKAADAVKASSSQAVIQAPKLAPVAHILPLVESSIFTLDGRSYLIEDTVGDGTCGVHAQFGIKINNRFYCQHGSLVARNELATELEALRNEPGNYPRGAHCLNDYRLLLLDLLIETGAKGINGKALASKLGPKAGQYQTSAAAIVERRDEASKNLPQVFCETFRKMLNGNARKFPGLLALMTPGLNEADRIAQKANWGNDDTSLLQAFHLHRVAIQQYFADPQFTAAFKAPHFLFTQLDTARAALDALKNQIYGDNEVHAAYSSCLRDTNYWFETNELCLFALMRGQGVKIVYQDIHGAIAIAHEVLAQQPDTRIVFHRDRHFMRCTQLA